MTTIKKEIIEAGKNYFAPERLVSLRKSLKDGVYISLSEWAYLGKLLGFNGFVTAEMISEIRKIINDDFKLFIALNRKNNNNDSKTSP